jgi:hypothetical protein
VTPELLLAAAGGPVFDDEPAPSFAGAGGPAIAGMASAVPGAIAQTARPAASDRVTVFLWILGMCLLEARERWMRSLVGQRFRRTVAPSPSFDPLVVWVSTHSPLATRLASMR